MPNFKPKNCKKLIVDESKNDTVDLYILNTVVMKYNFVLL